jgi:chaperone BCS1
VLQYSTKLDDALVRPGRIDHQINFSLATHERIRDIFERNYDDADSSTGDMSDSSNAKIHKQLIDCDNIVFDLRAYIPPAATVQHREVKKLAALFAETFSEGIFSPAEIRGYLLKRKADPEGAVRGAKAWRDARLEANIPVLGNKQAESCLSFRLGLDSGTLPKLEASFDKPMGFPKPGLI